MNSSQQIVSKKRVTEHGEVFTAPREVNAMLPHGLLSELKDL